MTLTEQELDEFIALFKADGWQVSREVAREGVARLLTLYEHLMRPTAAEMQALPLDDFTQRGNLRSKSPPTPSPLA